MDAVAPGSSAAFADAWRRQLPWWHLTFGIVWVAGLLITVLGSPGRFGKIVDIGGVVALAVVYGLFGTRALRREDLRLAVTYQVLAWAILLGLQLSNPVTGTWIFYFVLFPHMWAMLEPRWATLGTLVAVGALTSTRWSTAAFSPDALPAIAISAVISIGLAVALGMFIHRIVLEAQSRAVIVDELRSAQARLAAAERESGILQERERLSREIHDTLAQGFTSVITLARAVDAALQRGDADTARDRLELLRTTAEDNLSEARLIVAETTPTHLRSRTVAEALERLVVTLAAETGIDARFEVIGSPAPLGTTVEVVLVRAAQEALANVRRHSGAAHARVSLTYRDGEVVVLRVCDDGRGRAPDAATGFGLDGIHTRALEVGGVAHVDSTPGGGTTVTVQVPW